jgi:hypothetical protein
MLKYPLSNGTKAPDKTKPMSSTMVYFELIPGLPRIYLIPMWSLMPRLWKLRLRMRVYGCSLPHPLLHPGGRKLPRPPRWNVGFYAGTSAIYNKCTSKRAPQPTRHSIMGENGTSETVDAILEGDFDIDGTDLPPQMKQWLKSMQRTSKERDQTVQVEMTPKQFQEAFKAADEKTSSSPSGLHCTLWKAIAEKDDLCAYFLTMLSLPFMYCFVNDRWTKGIDVMLAKQQGNSQIHMTRLIGLLEADFNTALEWYYLIQTMGDAESSGLNPNQWGGLANRTATMCATRKLLLWEYARYARKTTASFFGDLSSCFDRVHTSIRLWFLKSSECPKQSANVEHKWSKEWNVSFEPLQVLQRHPIGRKTMISLCPVKYKGREILWHCGPYNHTRCWKHTIFSVPRCYS